MIATFALIISIAGATPVGKLHPSVLAARQKMVAKKRKEATKTIIDALLTEKNEIARTELKKELQTLSSVFITNEGQRIFELAESIRFSGQTGYLPKYEEALKTEDSNWQILLSQAVGHLRVKDCAKAALAIHEAESVNPEREETAILNSQTQLCMDASVVSREQLEVLPTKNYELMKKVLLAKKAATEKNYEQVLAVARKAIALDKSYPTPYYWAWQAIKDEENAGLDEAQSYLSLCKELSPMQRRKYFLDPELCLETGSVETFIKQMESQAP